MISAPSQTGRKWLGIKGRPTDLPNVPEGNMLVCMVSFSREPGVEHWPATTLEEMQTIYDNCQNLPMRGEASLFWFYCPTVINA